MTQVGLPSPVGILPMAHWPLAIGSSWILSSSCLSTFFSGAAPSACTDWTLLAHGSFDSMVKETRLWSWSGLVCETSLVSGRISYVTTPGYSSLLGCLAWNFPFGRGCVEGRRKTWSSGFKWNATLIGFPLLGRGVPQPSSTAWVVIGKLPVRPRLICTPVWNSK